MKYDAIIVGAGITGSVIARQLAERAGLKSLVIEKRNHIGGNMFDKFFENNVLVHMYGPHTFFTDDKRIIEYIQHYAEWKPLDVTAKVEIDNKLYSLPFGFSFIREYYAKEKAELLIQKLLLAFPDQERVTIYDLLNYPDSDISEFAKMLCEKDYYPYSAKQWGIPMEKMDASVISRVKFALSDDNRYIQQAYQYTPVHGYANFFENLLDSPNITVVQNKDALKFIRFSAEKKTALFKWEECEYQCPIVFTGPIDELFNYRFGALPYRSLFIDFKSYQQDSFQDVPFISYPQAAGYTRIVEYKKLTGQEIVNATTISVEYPQQYENGKNLPYYPIINTENINLYSRYNILAAGYKNLFICGRLGDYKYYNMDEAIIRAMEIEKAIEKYLNGEAKERGIKWLL